MDLGLLYVHGTEDRGKGCFAKQFIPAGSVIAWRCPCCSAFSKEQMADLDNDARMHIEELAFKDDNGDMIIPCGITKFMNHSCKSNVLPVLSINFLSIAVEDIEKDEEVTYDYRVFYLDGEESMQCLCGEDCCCGTVTNGPEIRSSMKPEWDARVEKAIRSIRFPKGFMNGLDLKDGRWSECVRFL